MAAHNIGLVAHNPDAELIAATTEPIARSPAAERMRRHRELRRLGLRCLTIQLRETEVDDLIKKGLLSADARNDAYAVRQALYAHLDATLNPNPWKGS